ncbi:hypothetical protein M153_26740001710, partial [Pseudoloma neurophilia]
MQQFCKPFNQTGVCPYKNCKFPHFVKRYTECCMGCSREINNLDWFMDLRRRSKLKMTNCSIDHLIKDRKLENKVKDCSVDHKPE